MIGSRGAGKSTLAARLDCVAGPPVHHLDAFYRQPGWVPTPDAEAAATIAELSAGPAWIMDGNYGRTMDQRLAECDTVVCMDLPRTVCLSGGGWTRWWRRAGASGSTPGTGCA